MIFKAQGIICLQIQVNIQHHINLCMTQQLVLTVLKTEKSFSKYSKNFPNYYKSEIIFQIWNLSGLMYKYKQPRFIKWNSQRCQQLFRISSQKLSFFFPALISSILPMFCHGKLVNKHTRKKPKHGVNIFGTLCEDWPPGVHMLSLQ